jgi:hypothetical protein
MSNLEDAATGINSEGPLVRSDKRIPPASTPSSEQRIKASLTAIVSVSGYSKRQGASHAHTGKHVANSIFECRLMNLEKVVFGFVIVLALTLNVAFVLGGSDANPEQHNIWILFAAVAVNLVATALKLGDRSPVGALLLATALVADLQLLASTLIWTFADDAASGYSRQ